MERHLQDPENFPRKLREGYGATFLLGLGLKGGCRKLRGAEEVRQGFEKVFHKDGASLLLGLHIGLCARWGTPASPDLPVQALPSRLGPVACFLKQTGNIIVHLVPVYKWGD